MELNLMEREILHRINAGRGRRPIAHIRFLMLEDKG
jgi:hypothetical protein